MFRCQACGYQSKAKEGQATKVVEVRQRTYENQLTRNRRTVTKKSEGFETVRELRVCQRCATKTSQ